jgi:hypothetical protein
MRKTFANTIRKDLHVMRRGRSVEVSGQGLTYKSSRANAQVAETINSKIPVAVIAPPVR